ncbi:YedE family putative selenium transporter [Haloimpatiens sp. FM7330]|uniref:YedE family putative selenium transporter n=1 Tax=Haloimpatiens sp. FM7330 TaxID=3298610 RepID=UPI00363D2637
MSEKKGIILTGAIVGFLAALLVYMGNPGNMGICIACFIRDTAGALGMHSVAKLSFIRPEVIGIILGAFIMSIAGKEFNVKGGSSPFIRFILGFIVMVGALVFLGCPLRMVLRLGGGDLNALVGLAGFAVGIGAGIVFLNKGFTLKRNYKLNKFEGYLFPIITIGLLLLLLAAPAFITLKGKHAPIWIALIVGLVVGILAQRTRLCMVGGIRDLILFKDNYLISGFISIFVFALIGNLIFGNFKLGFVGQPASHNDALWNFLGMFVAGWGSVLLGGCPMRQLILSAEGNIDSVMAVLGMFVGAAFCHNFALASSGKGPTPNGKIAVIIGLIVTLAISYYNVQKEVKFKAKGDVNVEAN